MRTAVLFLLLVAAAAALAGDGGTLDVEIRNRAVVAGAIGAPDELDTLRIRMPEGASLTVALRGVGKLSPELRILGPDDVPIDLAPFAVRDGKGVTVAPFAPGPAGLYRIDVRARDGAVGSYKLTAAWRLAASETFSGATGADGATYVFDAEAGTKITVDLGTDGGAGSVRAVKLKGPHGFEIAFTDPVRPSPVQRARTRALPTTGRYELTIATDAPGRGVSGTLKRKAPTKKSPVNLRGAERRGQGVARTVSRLVGSDGASFAVPRLEETQRVSIDATGVSLSVPAAVVSAPTSFRLRTDDDAIDDPLGFAPAGVSVSFDAGGATFAQDVAITLPYDVGAFAAGDVLTAICILGRDDAGGVFEVNRSSATVDVAGGCVTFPTSHFSSYQVFSPPVELVEVARAGAPNDLAAAPDGSAVYLSSDTLTSELPAAAVMRIAPGGSLELFAGGGSLVGDGVHRLDYDFDADIAGGALVSALAVDAAGNVLVVTADVQRTLSVVYIVVGDGIVVRVAGDGTRDVDESKPARETGLPFCCGAAFDSAGNVAVVTDAFLYPESDLVYAIVAEPGGGLEGIGIHAVAGGGEADVSGSPPRETRLLQPRSVLLDAADRILVGDRDWIVRFDLALGTTTTLAGTNFGETDAGTGGRTLGGLGAPLRTVVFGAIDDLAFLPGREDILYAADPEAGIVWRLDLERDRAFIAAGRRVGFGEALTTRAPDPDATDPDEPLNFPVAVAPLGADVFIAERFDDRLFSLRRRSQ